MNRGRHKKKVTKYPNTLLTNVLSDKELYLIFLRAEEQQNSINLQMIERDPTSARIILWDNTPEGWGFWNKILTPVVEYKSKNIL